MPFKFGLRTALTYLPDIVAAQNVNLRFQEDFLGFSPKSTVLGILNSQAGKELATCSTLLY